MLGSGGIPIGVENRTFTARPITLTATLEVGSQKLTLPALPVWMDAADLEWVDDRYTRTKPSYKVVTLPTPAEVIAQVQSAARAEQVSTATLALEWPDYDNVGPVTARNASATVNLTPAEAAIGRTELGPLGTPSKVKGSRGSVALSSGWNRSSAVGASAYFKRLTDGCTISMLAHTRAAKSRNIRRTLDALLLSARVSKRVGGSVPQSFGVLTGPGGATTVRVRAAVALGKTRYTVLYLDGRANGVGCDRITPQTYDVIAELARIARTLRRAN